MISLSISSIIAIRMFLLSYGRQWLCIIILIDKLSRNKIDFSGSRKISRVKNEKYRQIDFAKLIEIIESHLSSSSEYSILSLIELDRLYADFFLLPLILPFSRSNLYCGFIFSTLSQWLPPWCRIDFRLPWSELCSELALMRRWCSKAGLSSPKTWSLIDTRLFAISSLGLFVLPLISISISLADLRLLRVWSINDLADFLKIQQSSKIKLSRKFSRTGRSIVYATRNHR